MQKRLNKKRSRSRSWWLIILLLLFLVIFFFYRYFFYKNSENNKVSTNISSDTTSLDLQLFDTTLSTSDSISTHSKNLSNADSLELQIDTLKKIKVTKTSVILAKKDSIVKKSIVEPINTVETDSLKDSSNVVLPADPCKEDTSALWVFPDPSGGLHRKTISVTLVANRNCQIRYRFAGEDNWNIYRDEPVNIGSTVTLQFDATDSCGRKMELREEYYEIEITDKESLCPSGMEFVSIGSLKYCIDRYEWPNRKGVLPKSYISLYQAMDSCYSVSKRLCTSEEWTLACTGPHTYSYPYGQIYERYACATHDKRSSLSGSRPECRSFFGVYDMSGSLLEWTSTKADNRQFFYVMGGFYESGPQSGCSDKRYSYFPENQHNPVGFRCCSDIPEQSDREVKKIHKGRRH